MLSIYISGPMTGITDYNYPAFYNAEIYLSQNYSGAEIINPARLGSPDLSWEENIEICLNAIQSCNTIYLLKGWEDSRGAHMEIEEALKRRFVFLYQ